MKLTRKQIKFISNRPMTTVNNWINARAEMPEHIHCAIETIENFMKDQKKKISKFDKET